MAEHDTNQNTKDTFDQRYLPRWEVKNRLYFLSEDYRIPQEGQTRDLSCAGVSFQTAVNLNPKQKIKLTIYLSPQSSVKLDGQVAWVKTGDRSVYHVGVSFTNLSQRNQDIIFEHAFELNREQIYNHWFKGWDGQTKQHSTPP